MNGIVISEWIEQVLGLELAVQAKVISSLAVILILWITQKIISGLLFSRIEDLKTVYRWQKILGYTTFTVGFFVVGRIWFGGFGDLATFLGLVSAGIAIAMREPLVNLAGWAFILWRRPFDVGDRVQIGEHMGDVIDQSLFSFALNEVGNWVHAEQSTGRIIYIPNGTVFTHMVANFYKGFHYVWIEVPVQITFESDWRKAKEILQKVADTHAIRFSQAAEEQLKVSSRKFLIFYRKLTPIVYTSVSENGVLLTIRTLCRPRERRGLEQRIWESILEEFSRCDDIGFAYPSQRVFFNALEGKPQARAELTFGERP